MTRNKKRVLKRKQIRKQIKKNTNNKPSSEQQSRENEMLKVMLSRPQQIIPGQTQANDKIPIMRTKKGHENEQKKRTNGELMWKMDENGNYEYDYSKSKLKVQAKELADKRTELNERKIELEATQSQIESFNNIQKSLNQTKNDIDITTVELAAMKGYIDSSDYKRKLEDIQAQKQLVEAAKKKQEGEKFVYESKKKMAEIQAAGTVAYNFDPENLSPEANQAQLKTYTDLYMKALSTNLNAVQDLINANAERAAKLDTVMAKYYEIIERYPEDQRERVGNNISKLIYEKTEHQLPQNLGDFDTHNLNTANDFLNVIGSYAHEMLITPSQRDLFMNSEVFKNFKWDTTGHDLGSVFNSANSDE